MPWVKLDDQFPDHPKVAQAGDLGGWLWVCGLAYCRRQETEGRIPKAVVPKLVHARTGPLVALLLRLELWHDDGDHYVVHDYHDWNKPTENRRAAGRKAAKARWDAERKANAHAIASETHSEPTANGHAKRCPPPQPPPIGTSPHPPTDTPAPSAREAKLMAAAAGLLARHDLDRQPPGHVRDPAGWHATATARMLDQHRTSWLERLAEHPDLSSTQLADGAGRPPGDTPEAIAARHQAELQRSAAILAAADQPIDRSGLDAIKAARPRITSDTARPFGQEASP